MPLLVRVAIMAGVVLAFLVTRGLLRRLEAAASSCDATNGSLTAGVFSQNVQFTGEVAPDEEFEHPAGASLARVLQAAVRDAGWAVDVIDNWRDCGWYLNCRRGEAALQVAFTALESPEPEWMLQISVQESPGFLARSLGRRPSGGNDDVLALARVVHSTLAADSHLSRFRWQWSGFPHDGQSTPEPLPWNDASLHGGPDGADPPRVSAPSSGRDGDAQKPHPR